MMSGMMPMNPRSLSVRHLFANPIDASIIGLFRRAFHRIIESDTLSVVFTLATLVASVGGGYGYVYCSTKTRLRWARQTPNSLLFFYRLTEYMGLPNVKDSDLEKFDLTKEERDYLIDRWEKLQQRLRDRKTALENK